MKKLLLSFILSIAYVCMGQKYLQLSTGDIVSNHLFETMPNRTVEIINNGLKVTYHFNYVSIDSDNLFPSRLLFGIDGFGIVDTPGLPAIPMRRDFFTTATNQSYTISVVDSSFVEISADIAPARHPLWNSSNEIYTTENIQPISPYSGFYPLNIISASTCVYKNNMILDISISPVQYDYQQSKVRVYKDITYLVHYTNSNNNSDSAELAYRDIILQNTTLNLSNGHSHRSSSTSVSLEAPKYLIITVPKYNSVVTKFADWKRTLGFNVEILSQTSWDETSVRNAIVTANNNYSIDYLLIVGDNNDVPGKYTNGHYTDYYYGCIGQNSFPDIRRGRIPASTLYEAETIINKIIKYQKCPIIDSLFYHTGVNCAYFQDDNTDGYENRRFTLTSEEIRTYLLSQNKNINRVYYANSDVDPQYWNNTIYGFNTTTPIPSELLRSNGFQWDGGYNDIFNYINTGVFYVFHRDHGAINKWVKPEFDITHVNQLSNGDKQPVVFSMNCWTGKYDNDNCFARSFLNKSNGGCVAIFAASDRSLSGYNDALSLAMFDAIWPNPGFVKRFPNGTGTLSLSNVPIYRLGDCLDQGLAQIKEIYPAADNVWLQYTKEIFHLFGDPSMDFYTEVPTAFTNVNITIQNGSIKVMVGEEAVVSIFNYNDGAIDSFYGSDIEYPISGDLRICISNHNKIPYVIEFANGTLYVQNENIRTSSAFIGDNIKVGTNVTSSKPIGEVSFKKGKTLLMGNTIELCPGTTIELGSELEIKN